MYVNSSPQRRDQFYELQPDTRKLVPIQDVRTRWNSTFLMLRRAKRLRLVFDQFCLQYGLSHLMLDHEHWRQIDYLLWITQPFFKFTTALSKSKDVTIHLVFGIYNMLFDHLKKSIRQLQRKKVPWKKVMLTALHTTKDKLSSYYSQTDQIYGDIFAIGTILAPQNKLQFFKDWAEDEEDWVDRYRRSFYDFFKPYQQRLAKRTGKAPAQPNTETRAEMLLDLIIHQRTRSQDNHDEFAQYIKLGISLVPLASYITNFKKFDKANKHPRVVEGAPAPISSPYNPCA